MRYRPLASFVMVIGSVLARVERRRCGRVSERARAAASVVGWAGDWGRSWLVTGRKVRRLPVRATTASGGFCAEGMGVWALGLFCSSAGGMKG